jgi:Cd2+/Zn2+-exporting ATPase
LCSSHSSVPVSATHTSRPPSNPKQASRPKLTRWIDSIGAVWSRTVISASLATAFLLPLLGVPFWGDRGSLYRAMAVLTAGSPCALALVPLAYVCAIAAITQKGILVKSSSAIDALRLISTVALDKTGTITAGQLSVAQASTLTLTGSSNSSGNGNGGSGNGSSSEVSGSDAAEKGTQHQSTAAGAGAAQPLACVADWERGKGMPAMGSSVGVGSGAVSFGEGVQRDNMLCALALSRLSNHPISQAMVRAGEEMGLDDSQVTVASFKQVCGWDGMGWGGVG